MTQRCSIFSRETAVSVNCCTSFVITLLLCCTHMYMFPFVHSIFSFVFSLCSNIKLSLCLSSLPPTLTQCFHPHHHSLACRTVPTSSLCPPPQPPPLMLTTHCHSPLLTALCQSPPIAAHCCSCSSPLSTPHSLPLTTAHTHCCCSHSLSSMLMLAATLCLPLTTTVHQQLLCLSLSLCPLSIANTLFFVHHHQPLHGNNITSQHCINFTLLLSVLT